MVALLVGVRLTEFITQVQHLSKTIKLFQEANDLTEDNKFIAGSLDNKLIRVTLISHIPVGEAGDHFPAALVVKSVKIQSDAPSITLTPSKLAFEAGMGYQTPWQKLVN